MKLPQFTLDRVVFLLVILAIGCVLLLDRRRRIERMVEHRLKSVEAIVRNIADSDNASSSRAP
jgi:hypothetical protein